MRIKSYYLLFIFIVLCTSAYSQALQRNIVQGDGALSKSSVRLSATEQIPFNPAKVKSIVGMDGKSDLTLRRKESDALGQNHYRYQQTYKDIPVEDAVYIVHEKGGMMTGMDGKIIMDFNAAMAGQPVQGGLTKEEAVAKALQHVNAKRYAWQDAHMEEEIKSRTGKAKATMYPDPEKTWYSAGPAIDAANLHLTFKVDIYALEPLSRAFYFIDAHTGEVLGKKDQIHYSDTTGTAETTYSGNKTIHNDYVGGKYYLRDFTKGNGVITHDASHTGEISNTSPDWTFVTAPPGVLDVHYGMSQAWLFYKTVFNRNSIDNNGYALVGYANNPCAFDNAYWDGSSMTFGIRTWDYWHGVSGIDIVGHELTHGLTQFTSGLANTYEQGAINESMSDIMGKSIQFWSKPEDIDWVLSNDMKWNGMSFNIRNMSNPNEFSDPDTYHGTYWYSGLGDYGGVHTNSGVGNFMFYLLVNGGGGTNDIGNTYLVNGIGLTAADAIIYRTETVYLTPTSQYADWRTACINAATDLYGAGSNEVMQVKNAWYAVGIGTPGYAACSSVPEAGTIASTSVCNSFTATLNLSGYTTATGVALQWQNSIDGTNFVNISQAQDIRYLTPVLTAAPGVNYFIYYRCIATCKSGGSTDTSNIATLAVHPTPVVTVSSNTPVCLGKPIYLNASGGKYYSWTPRYTWSSSLPNPVIPKATFNDNGWFRVTVTDSNQCVTDAYHYVEVSGAIPAPPVLINTLGGAKICPGNLIDHNVAPVEWALYYTWTAPAGSTVVSGQGTNAIKVSYDNTFVSGNLKVTATSGCGTSGARSTTITKGPPLQPDAIVVTGGSIPACPGDARTCSVTAGIGLIYNWTPPAGVSIVSGQGTNKINISYGASFVANGNLSVTASNACGTSVPRLFSLTRNIPPAPGPIQEPSGLNAYCPGDHRLFSVPNVAGMTYKWTPPAGVVIDSGQGKSLIYVTFNTSFTANGTLKVAATNACGTGAASSLSLVRNLPIAPGAISGPVSVCKGALATYSVSLVANTRNFSWTAPAGATIQGPSGGNILNVLWGTTGGSITVKSYTNCGSSAVKSLAVAVTCRTGGSENNSSIENAASIYPNPVSGMLTLEYNAASAGKYSIEILDVTGRCLKKAETESKEGMNLQRIDLAALPKGIYIFSISDIDFRKDMKLIVQ